VSTVRFTEGRTDNVRDPALELGPVKVYGPPCAVEPAWATLLVGEAPNRWMEQNNAPHHALWRHDLAGLAGLTMLEFLRCFARCDLLDRYPGRQGRGSAFPLAEARPRADALLEALRSESSPFVRVVLVGRRTAQACGHSDPWFYWRTLDVSPARAIDFACAPHPSKVSTWWRDEGNVAQARAFWTGLGKEILEPLDRERQERRRISAAVTTVLGGGP
jgi:hypothetical protein